MKQVKSTHLSLLAMAAVAVVALAGCGSSDESTSSTSSTTADAPSPEKAAYIAKVDQLCTDAGAEIDAKVQKRIAKIGEDNLSNKDLVDVFSEISIPGLEDLYAKIAKVPPPPGDEAEVQAIQDAVDKALRESKADPEKLAVISGDGTPFDEASKLQQEYGFQVCGGGDPAPDQQSG